MVKCSSDGCPPYGPLSAVPYALSGYGQHITSLTLNAASRYDYPDFDTASAFVRGIATVCPNLTPLAFDFPCLLPPPGLLPSLTHLDMKIPLEYEGEWVDGDPRPDEAYFTDEICC